MRPEDNPQDWHQQKTYESMLTYGSNAIKFIMLANGGAIISILTFIGHHTEMAKSLKPAMLLFASGIIIVGVVNITAYFTQLSLFNQRTINVPLWSDHRTWLWISISLISAGTSCFAVGAVKAILAFE